MATTSSPIAVSGHPYYVTEVQVSSITAGQDIDVSHGGPPGASVSKMEWEVIERPTSRHAVTVEHDKENDSTTNDTARVAIDTEVGGDLAGAVVLLRFTFFAQASGGIG